MAEIIAFTPRGREWGANLADYVAAAKALPFMTVCRIAWDADSWDLSGLAKPERATDKPRVTFAGGRSRTPSLTGAMGDFARAFVAFRIAEDFGLLRQIGKYTKPVLMMRVLVAVMAERGASEPEDITPAMLDAAVERIRVAGGKPYGIEQRSKALEHVAGELNRAGIVRSPFDWSIATPLWIASRINKYEDDRNFTKDEIEAVAEAFVKARTPREQIVTGIVAILCSVPARISELLELPVDCDIVLDPGDGFQAGLRWWPKKGGAPQVKFVPKAMVPVVEEALARIKRHTESARRLASAVLEGKTVINRLPEGWPNLPGRVGLTYDRALMVAHPYTLAVEREPDYEGIEAITYHQIRAALQGANEAPTLFETMGVRLPDGSPLIVNTHKPRHYLNTLANKASVPQADIALWSGRKNSHQNSAYDHETAQELLGRIRKARGLNTLPAIPITDQSAFDIAQIKETAHTTRFGWCAQSLRQNPCQMFGECLNCTHLVCIKGAEGKLENIRRELARERDLRGKARERIAGGLRASPRWMDLFDRKIARLEELVRILESDDVIDGSAVLMADVAQLPQFDPVGPGKARSAAIPMHPNRERISDAEA